MGQRKIFQTIPLSILVASSVFGSAFADVTSTQGAVTASLNGAVVNVYTYRTYAADRNGGAIASKIDIGESLAGTLAAGDTLSLSLSNAATGTTAYSTLAFSPTAPSFTNPGASFQAAAGQFLTQGGYDSTPGVFTSSILNDAITSASTSALKNTISFPGLTIGNKPGPVTVAPASKSLGALPAVTIANAINASSLNISPGFLPTLSLAGAAAALPTMTISEAAAGALATETGGVGQVSVTLINGTYDTSSSISATWCGSVVPASNISGASTTTLTITLPSVSTVPCSLVINSKASAALIAAPGSAIVAAVNSKLTDSAQATFKQVQVASILNSFSCGGYPGAFFPGTTKIAAAASPTGRVFSPSFAPALPDQNRKADTYVIAYWQGVFLYRKRAIAGCAGWTTFSPERGEVAQPYEAGIVLGTSYQAGNINDCDISALNGVSVYLGYGAGTINAQTWNAMLANGTYSYNPVLQTVSQATLGNQLANTTEQAEQCQ